LTSTGPYHYRGSLEDSIIESRQKAIFSILKDFIKSPPGHTRVSYYITNREV
jgi:hypothetical protein